MKARPKVDSATQCEGKRRFDSFSLASEVVNRKRNTDLSRGIYKCPYCHGWHLGTNSGHKKTGKGARNA